MIQVSDWFKTWMEKQTLNLLRKFTYDGVHETERVEGFGSINRASDAIVSGGTSLALINTDKHWNKFLSDKSNLRRQAKLQLAIGVPNTPARSGIARSGATLSNLLSYCCIAGNQEWLDILTGWADDPEFPEALVNLPIRDKFARLLEKELGSKEDPLDYYSASYNPADLAWDILTTHGGLDSTASTANTDIDYTTWLAWKTACTAANLSLEARFTGQSIREALELIRDLTNSDIYEAGNGKIKFYRFTQAAPPLESYLFHEDRFANLSVRLDSEKIVNHLTVHYGLNLLLELITNCDMEAEDSWTDRGTPTTNARSAEQANSGTHSRKIVTDALSEGAYQDIATVVGRWYEVEAYIYVSAGDAKLGKEDTDGSDQVLSSQGTLAEWKKFTLTFKATEIMSRIFFQSDATPASTFYVDDLSVKWVGPQSWDGSYLKQDAASQTAYTKSSEVIDGTAVWHATLASATSYADRRVDVFKNPLDIAIFTSFMMGMITEIGDIIRISDSFFGYASHYFRVFRIATLNLANASITFEAADFQDVMYYFYLDDSHFGLLDQTYNPLY